MKRFTILALMLAFVLGLAVAAKADTEVKMSGDARIHGNWRSGMNFTPWNSRGMAYWTGTPQAAIANVAAATGSSESFSIWERFRLRTDFIANEALKFRFGIRANNAAWGNAFAIDSPPIAIDVNQAYVQFLIPTTDAQVTAGYMPLALPHSKIFNGGLILDTQGINTAAAALVIDVPVVKDTFAIKAGYTRLLDANADTYVNTTPVDNALDAFFLALPITVNGFQAIPWGAVAFAGRAANYTSVAGNLLGGGSGLGAYDGNLTANLLSAASMYYVATGRNVGGLVGAMWQNMNNTYYWFGLPLNITAADPINFYADVLYGNGNSGDSSYAQRSGWFLDAGVEYVGLDMVKPQLMGWWSTGETGSLADGSSRIPMVRQFWSPGASFLYQTGASAFTRSTLCANPAGSWGLVFSLKDITFIKELKSTLSFSLANGTNSPSYARMVNAIGLGGAYMQMGKDLTMNEYLFSINLDSQYMIYENLAAILELGWATCSGLQGSVWGTRNVNNYQDAWKVAFGFKYTF